MLEVGFILATISSLAWSILNVLRKQLLDRCTSELIVLWLLLGQVPCFALWWINSQTPMPEPTYYVFGLASVLMTITSQLLILRALELSDISLAVPFLSFVPVITAFVGLFLGEWLSLWQWIGVILVVLGGFTIHLGDGDHFFSKLLAGLASLPKQWSSFLMLCTATIWGIQIPMEKYALQFTSVPFHGVFVSLLSGVSMIFFVHWKSKGAGRFREQLAALSFKEKFLLFAVPLSVFLALSFQFLTIKIWPVAVYESYHRAFEVAVGVLAGAVLFKERITMSRVVSATVMVLGSLLVILF